MRRRLANRLTVIGLICALWFAWSVVWGWTVPPAIAQTFEEGLGSSGIPTVEEPIRTGYQFDGAELTGFSFDDLGELDTAGSISGNFNEQAGYEVGRSWEAGDSLADVIRLGDISSDFGAETVTLDQVSRVLGEDLNQRPLSDFEPLINADLNTLSDSLQFFTELPVTDAPPVEALFEQAGFTFEELEFQQIGGVLSDNPALGELRLSDLGGRLSEFSIGQLPNADTVRIDALDGWENAAISDIPGLANLPFNQFPAGIGAWGGELARIDFIWSTAETDRTRTISGSYQAGFNVPCPEAGRLTEFASPYAAPEANNPPQCAYLELDDLEDEGESVQSDFEGSQWISGKYHEVDGGFGPLKFTPSPLGYTPGYEPTGRHPFGSAFKVVVWEPDERSDQVSFRLFFRWCTTIPFVGRTCTPYNQFAVPFVSHRINDIIFMGALDGAGGSAALGGDQRGFEETGYRVPGAPTSSIPCTGEVIDGIDTGALATAIAEIESQGSGGYRAIGPYTCADGGVNCGRGLGRYQTMSYLASVRERIQQRPGGTAFLNRIEAGYRPSQAEIQEFYPPEDQEAVYQEEINVLLQDAQGEIDPQTGQPFAGQRLIERTAQKWFGGPASEIDGGGSDTLGRLSLYDYGVEARQNYLAQGGQPSTACAAISAEGEAGTATGDLVNPAPGYPITSPYGPRNIGCQYSKFHPAVDLGTPIGTPIQASDGGVVQFSSCNAGGYGCTVVIDHGNGTKTRYSHLRRGGLNVRQGQAVAQGEQIAESGNTGSSTGPHLDYGIYVDDTTGPGQLPAGSTAIDPQTVINF